MLIWKAANDVQSMLDIVLPAHLPRLDQAKIVIAFDDNKPFVQNKLNLGKVTKFSPLAKLLQTSPHDFCLSIPSDLWHSILSTKQREAYLDLQLARCTPEYIPETIEENGKKKTVKDEWGRIQYTQERKLDDSGNPKWKVVPLDLEIFADNVRRYGLWHDGLLEFQNAIVAAKENHAE